MMRYALAGILLLWLPTVPVVLNAASAQAEDGAPEKPAAPVLKVPSQEEIDQAVERGVAWLKKAQLDDGSWKAPSSMVKSSSSGKAYESPHDYTGSTAFALYCLARCGVSKKDKVFKKGLTWLKRETLVVYDMTGDKDIDHLGRPVKKQLRTLTTYESAAILMLIEAMNAPRSKNAKKKKRRLYTDNPLKRPRGSKIPKDEWEWLHNRVLALTKGRRKSNGRDRGSITLPGHQLGDGGWAYRRRGAGGQRSNLSATHFALLALRAASRAGYPMDVVAPKVWVRALKWVKSVQTDNGGFAYQGSEDWTNSMTACGVASLVICKEQMELAKQPLPKRTDSWIKSGTDALGVHYYPGTNHSPTGAAGYNYYYMYAVERAGAVLGKREFGGADWYARGARLLVDAQRSDGKWVDDSGHKPHDVLGTCFALVFLKRATHQ